MSQLHFAVAVKQLFILKRETLRSLKSRLETAVGEEREVRERGGEEDALLQFQVQQIGQGVQSQSRKIALISGRFLSA